MSGKAKFLDSYDMRHCEFKLILLYFHLSHADAVGNVLRLFSVGVVGVVVALIDKGKRSY